MYGLAPYIACGLAGVLMMECLPTVRPGRAVANSARFSPTVVDRTHKGDRLAPVIGLGKTTIAAVEIVGLRNAAIVYLDRNGQELFRTDPLSNATVVVKDVVLPEVTIRDRDRAGVAPVQIELYGAPAGPVTPTKLPAACDPAFGRLTAPSMPRVAGRCFAAGARILRVAALSD